MDLGTPVGSDGGGCTGHGSVGTDVSRARPGVSLRGVEGRPDDVTVNKKAQSTNRLSRKRVRIELGVGGVLWGEQDCNENRRLKFYHDFNYTKFN